jgi:hypothetical protein
MPLVEPGGRRFNLSPAVIVAVLVGALILVFVGYLGLQFMRFVDVTDVALTYPTNVFSQIDAEQITLQGTASRGSQISITGPDSQVYPAQADPTGKWTRTVPLARGQNNFSVVATDTVTGRPSKELLLTIVVPLPSASPGASASAAPPPAITMNLFSPTDGFTTSDPSVTVSGTTTGTGVKIESTYLGAPAASPVASGSPVASVPASGAPASGRPAATAVASAAPSASVSPGASGTPSASGAPPIGPAADITVPAGSFSEPLTFPIGHWRVTVTSYATGIAPVAQSVELTVLPPPVTLNHLDILVAGRSTSLKVDADGIPVPEINGITVNDQETYSATAASEFCVRAGNPGVISLTLNGTPLGLLGPKGVAGSWIIKPGQPPQPAATPC